MQNRIKALQWAQVFTATTTVDALLRGVDVCDAFLTSVDGMDEAKDAALSAAMSLAILNGDPAQSWESVVGDASRIFKHLTAPFSSTLPARCAVAEPRSGGA